MLVTLWVGGLWAIGYLAAPTLFAAIPDRMLAGAVAGRLFSGMAWTGIACGTLLFALWALRLRGTLFRDRQAWLVGAMLALTLAGQFGVQPVLQRLKDEAAPAPVMESRPSSPPFSQGEKGDSSLLSPSGREVGRAGSRAAFGRWHGISSGIYLVQSLLGLALVVTRSRRAS